VYKELRGRYQFQCHQSPIQQVDSHQRVQARNSSDTKTYLLVSVNNDASSRTVTSNISPTLNQKNLTYEMSSSNNDVIARLPTNQWGQSGAGYGGFQSIQLYNLHSELYL